MSFLQNLRKFLNFWGISILLWIGVAYELYALWPKILEIIQSYL